jgi:FAD/FMN-containing dehydrogenase/Fe-S oxidoreductase
MEKKELKKLESELKATVDGEVLFDAGARALYATDGSNYRQPPIGVVIPKTKEAIIKTIHLCHKYQAPLFSRGGGTSLAGQCCNTAIVMDMSKCYNKILKIDPLHKYAIVQPGVVLDTLRQEVKKFDLTFGPDPSTHAWCTLGGMMGNNSCGTHSQMGGRTDDNVIEMEVMTYDGTHLVVGETTPDKWEEAIKKGGREAEIYVKLKKLAEKYGELIKQKYPHIPRRISGYNLPWLLEEKKFNLARALVGSESTCVTILEAKLQLIYNPPVRTLLVLGYPDVYTAADHVPELDHFGAIGLEGLDDVLVENMLKKKEHTKDVKLLPEGKGWLIVQFGGRTKKEADEKAKKLLHYLQARPNAPSMKLYDDPSMEQKIIAIRESGLGATARVPGQKDTWEGWEDSAVPPANLGNYLRDLRELYKKYEYACALYGHFGQGCVHTRIDFDMYTFEGLKKYRSFVHEAADLVLKYGGSFSGEHGDGQSRGELLSKMFGEELVQAFREFKKIWDPDWKMNPGKKIDAYDPIQNIRLGPHYKSQKFKTHFSFAGDDEGSFARATLRCVGVGKCRRKESENAIMCPSYQVTHEEKHSTRGRAHLLFEMIEGKVIGKHKWKDKAVKEALDLCLSCKGCKTDCPMNVDMATYKAEFLSHYYKGRLRKRSAYAFGLIFIWARLATKIPKLVNALGHAHFFSKLAKWMAGMPKERTIPKFAEKNFKEWFFQEKKGEPASENLPEFKGTISKKDRETRGKRVLLWADTFNTYFHPQVARAATEVLEHLGFKVVVPQGSLCCGRPLYDYGMLKKAKKLLEHILGELYEEIKNGTPLVGLEPSCLSVFRDEMRNLFPSDLNATILAENSYMISEFIQKFAPHYKFPPLHKKALVHGHCHHKTVLKFEAENALLKRLMLDFEVLDSGCCGMAGSFGFEKEHYEVSIKCAQRALIPGLRKVEIGTLVITNGFSCHEQIMQMTGIKPLHLAEVLLMSLHSAKV